jgi:hypothetical protein
MRIEESVERFNFPLIDCYLVEHEKQLLMAFFFTDIRLDLPTASSQRITGVQNL